MMINNSIALACMAQIEQNILEMPIEVLQEAKRRQEIEAWNEAVEKSKRQRIKRKMIARSRAVNAHP